MKLSYRNFLVYAIPLFITAVVSLILSIQVRQVALSHDDNVTTFYSYADGFQHLKQLRQEWRPRIASTFLAGQFMDFFPEIAGNRANPKVMQEAFGYWTGSWFFLCCLLMIFLFKERSLLFIFGTFTGVLFAYTNGIGIMRVYPWDMPALFVFCAFIAMIKTKKQAWLPLFIPLAMLFKETAIVLVVALLFWPGASWKKRILFASISLVAGLGVKTAVDLITGNPSPLFTMTYRDIYAISLSAAYQHTSVRGGSLFAVSLLKSNILKIFTMWPDSPFFINAGLLTVLFVLPIKQKAVAMLKCIAGLFLVGNLLFGVINEYRIWFEMIPIALYALDLYLFAPTQEIASTQT